MLSADRSINVERRPRVSIGVPVFNGERFLEQALQSLVTQTFSDIEIVISDNASTDRTGEICRAFAAQDHRIRYYRNEVNHGASWNFNRVFDLARGEFFKWAAADDICAPDFLARCVTALDQFPAAVMAMTNVAEIDEFGHVFDSITVPGNTLVPAIPSGAPAHVRFRQTIRPDHICINIFGLIRSDMLRRVGPMKNYEDADRLILAHLALLGPCAEVPEVLLFNRDHAGRFCQSSKPETGWYYGWTERSAWWDPANANRHIFPTWRKMADLRRIVSRTPMSLLQRLRCRWEIIRFFCQKRQLRLLYVDATHYPRKWTVQHFPWAKVAWNWMWGKRRGRWATRGQWSQ